MTEKPPGTHNDVWDIPEAGFSEAATVADKLRFLLRYAVLAPSERNTQPWLFTIENDAVELYADLTRTLQTVDPDGRELVMSCGAALFYLRIAMRHYGYEPRVELLPSDEDPDLLARVRLGKERPPTPLEEALFQAIPHRRTNRYPFKNKKISHLVLVSLREAARVEGAELHIISDIDRQYALADLIAEGDHMQWADQDFRSEYAGWVLPNESRGHEGMPGYALGMGDEESNIAPLMMEAFDLSKGIANNDYKLAIVAPALTVLSTSEDTPRDWIVAGQAIARVLLRAACEGVSAAFFNQPIEIEAMRKQVTEVTGAGGFAQLMLRMGYGPEVKPTPRRTVDEVTF